MIFGTAGTQFSSTVCQSGVVLFAQKMSASAVELGSGTLFSSTVYEAAVACVD
jgi:hypothetical protein